MTEKEAKAETDQTQEIETAQQEAEEGGVRPHLVPHPLEAMKNGQIFPPWSWPYPLEGKMPHLLVGPSLLLRRMFVRKAVGTVGEILNPISLFPLSKLCSCLLTVLSDA
eukprot:Gb_38094 [translate_table: standard]